MKIKAITNFVLNGAHVEQGTVLDVDSYAEATLLLRMGRAVRFVESQPIHTASAKQVAVETAVRRK